MPNFSSWGFCADTFLNHAERADAPWFPGSRTIACMLVQLCAERVLAMQKLVKRLMCKLNSFSSIYL